MKSQMIKALLVVFVTFTCNLAVAVNKTGKSDVQANTNPVILVLGDSISAAYGISLNQGWVALLEQRLHTENYSHRVINASVSGNTTADGLKRLPKLLKQYTPDIVVIELGGNDGLRGYPVKLMKNNIQNMIDLSQKINAKVLLTGIEIPPNYGTRYTSLFRKAFQDLKNSNTTIQYDPFILAAVATKPELMQDDGIHPTAIAQPQLLDNVWDDLLPLL